MAEETETSLDTLLASARSCQACNVASCFVTTGFAVAGGFLETLGAMVPSTCHGTQF